MWVWKLYKRYQHEWGYSMNKYISKRTVCLKQFVIDVNVKQLKRGSIAGDDGSEKQKQHHWLACCGENTV